MTTCLMLTNLIGITGSTHRRKQYYRSGLAALSPLLLLPLAILACVQATPVGKLPPQTPPMREPNVPIAVQTPTAETELRPGPTPTSVKPMRAGPALLPIYNPGPLPVPPERDLYNLAQQLRLKTQISVPRTFPGRDVALQEGYQEGFKVADLNALNVKEVNATLKVVSEHAYWFVEDGLNIPIAELREASKTFEDKIYPVVTSLFGDIWNPGVDNDPHLVILHTHIPGLAGYYSSADEYPVAVHPYSNQREMIYINGDILKVGTPSYLGTLAHELQHAIHWRSDPTEEAWVNEGLSEVAKEMAGYHAYFAQDFRRNSETQLNSWPEDSRLAPSHYGASNLFFLYLIQHYGGYQNLKLLLDGPEDGVEAVNAYLTRLGSDKTFKDVFKDWVIANTVNASEGLYGYTDRKVPILDTKLMIGEGSRSGELGQFGSHYINLRFTEGDVLVSFEGNETVSLIPVKAHSGDYCWWSNRGDSIDSTLTRQFDLSRLARATLEFWAWYELEEIWDYNYVEVSTDGGLTWDLLKGLHTSEANPIGNSFGHGLTGKSDGWIQERFDLTPYAGNRVLLRFQYITDDAVNLRGLCMDDLSIPELGYFDDAEEDRGWQAEGFVRTSNQLPQDFFVQVIEEGKNTRVREMLLDQNRKGEMLIEGFGSQVKDAILVISPVTLLTTEPAHYTLTVKRIGEK